MHVPHVDRPLPKYSPARCREEQARRIYTQGRMSLKLVAKEQVFQYRSRPSSMKRTLHEFPPRTFTHTSTSPISASTSPFARVPSRALEVIKTNVQRVQATLARSRTSQITGKQKKVSQLGHCVANTQASLGKSTPLPYPPAQNRRSHTTTSFSEGRPALHERKHGSACLDIPWPVVKFCPSEDPFLI